MWRASAQTAALEPHDSPGSGARRGGRRRKGRRGVSGNPGIRWTWAQFGERVEALATGFIGLGLKPGDRIGIWGPNMPEWLLTQFASAPCRADPGVHQSCLPAR